MGFLAYIFTYFLVWLLHLLPRFLFYFISDLLALFTQYVVRYRRRVVRQNLSSAFPEYDLRTIRRTERRFYRHLCDMILETARSHFQSDEQYRRNLRYLNPELFDRYHKKGKQLIVAFGHYGNWEYHAMLGDASAYQVLGTYRPLRNPYFDRLVKRNRERFNNVIVPVNQMTRKMIEYKGKGELLLTIILTDQSPMFHQIQYWTKFLGLDTAIYTGTERLARKLDAAVVCLKTRKVARGRYEATIVPICEDPGMMEPNAITEAHVRILEEQIREEPAHWLWSHRRWKHSMEQYLEEQKEKEAAGHPG